MVAGIKQLGQAPVGDTITEAARPAAAPLPGYRQPKAMVFCGLHPSEGGDYPLLRAALEKLRLNDAALTFEPESSPALGFGFRCGFLGLMHLEIVQVRRTPAEKLFGSLMEAHHYLAYTQPVGEHLKYLIYARGQPVACLAWSSAPRHLGPRDRFIGWSPPQRRAQVHLLAYNTRFLILPWVKVPGLASHLLARVARRIAADWQHLYHHPVYLLETFIDPERFRGTCYRAANWIYLGLTAGVGKDATSRVPNRSFKQLWVYPLRPDFRRQLGGAGHG
jgi:hypothetical protein